MNGAAMDCRQDQVHRSQHIDSSNLHCPGNQLPINHPSHQNSHQHSKAMSYESLPQPFSVAGSSEYSQLTENYNHYSRFSLRPITGDVADPRCQAKILAKIRKPLELPVPQFEIDAHSIIKQPRSENSKPLDLDTRIDLLIKSRALAGMHPIFSELDESEESSCDSDDHFISKPRLKKSTSARSKVSPPTEQVFKTFDDSETPLSRPPSPFLSRATYLFWFNKAIEIKLQAKAQEQALLEKATKALFKENALQSKTNPNQEDKSFLDCLLKEVSKELKAVVKQEFIREILENSAYHALETWWDKQRYPESETFEELSINLLPNDQDVYSSKSSEKLLNSSSMETEEKLDLQLSTSPKEPFPWRILDVKPKQSSNEENKNKYKIVQENPAILFSKSLSDSKHLGSSSTSTFKENSPLLCLNNDKAVCFSSSQKSIPEILNSEKLIEMSSVENNTINHTASDSSVCMNGNIGDKTDENLSESVRDILDLIVSNVVTYDCQPHIVEAQTTNEVTNENKLKRLKFTSVQFSFDDESATDRAKISP